MAVDATLAIHEVNRVFPAGTSLYVYLHDSQSISGCAPQGTPAATAEASDPDFASEGFEVGVDDWALVEETGTGGALAAEETITRGSSDGSAKITAGTGDDSVGIVGPDDEAADQISIVEDETLSVSAYVYSAAGTPDASVTITWLDDEAAPIDTDTGTPVATVAETWVAVSASAAAPADTVAATITVAIDSPANASVYYVDDVTALIAGEPEDTTFTGLDGDTDYVAWGQVSGVWRQLGFRTPEEA
ncbi:MAG: hypothetical protein HUU17_06190 [Chthonomonadales bacterium]|nr:hypothetical protein [Chthonomonadales bacterium]